MKKTLAFLLCLAMLFTALSVNVFAAGPTAKVTVVANSPDSSNNVTFAVKLSGFDSLKGIDLKITGTGLTFGDTVTATNVENELSENTNFTVSDTQIHIVELTSFATDPVIISGSATLTGVATHEISVSCNLAKSGTELYALNTEYTVASATVNPYVAPVNETVTVPEGEKTAIVKQPEGIEYFIPSGAVYSGDVDNPEYAVKDENGDFKNVPNGATVQKFAIPKNGFGTYAARKSLQTPKAMQFGNYVQTKIDKQYGSLVISGDWKGFSEWYLKNKGLSEEELINLIYIRYLDKKDAGDTRAYIPFAVNTNQYVIKVFNVLQTKYLWKNTEGTQLEYGVLVTDAADNRDYSTVAYSVNKSYNRQDIEFASDFKTEKYTAQ